MSDGTRYLLYTNECVGLGHLRRALTLADAITARDDDANVLIITGSSLVPGYRLPDRVDTVKLPLLGRNETGKHRARSLAVGLGDIHGLRSEIALTAARSFAPDVVVVDKTPIGLGGELVDTLEELLGTSCPMVLGLRDIEDDQARVRRAWEGAGMRRAIERYYDSILVYGPEGSASAIACMGWDDLTVPVHHVGYVGAPLPADRPGDLPDGYVVVTAGGGADGFPLLSAYLEAIALDPLPFPSVVVTGPLMPSADVDRLRALAAGKNVLLYEVRIDMPAVIAGSRAVVSMAGYNTVSEALRAGKRALLVPRVRPSSEQWLRASALAELGLADMLHPHELVPAVLRPELDRLLDPGRARPHGVEAKGAERAAELLAELAGEARSGAGAPFAAAVAGR
jgi:predicted glycosyltransferase